MRSSRRALWLYPLFQIPLIFVGVGCLGLLLFALLGLGRPTVGVAVALDLSNSTYESGNFNAPGSTMSREIDAVRAYLNENSPQNLRRPNQVQIFGFGGEVVPLTQSFSDNSQKVKRQLTQVLQDPQLPEKVEPNQTDIDQVIQKGISSLESLENTCRELLLVTDGKAEVAPATITQAALKKVRLHSIIIGQQAPELRKAALATQGIYLSGQINNLDVLFAEDLFSQFNSNLPWIIFWIGFIWIALMWLLVLPLDRWVLQGMMKLPMPVAGKIALGNAFFWSAATPGIVWRLAGGIPWLSRC